MLVVKHICLRMVKNNKNLVKNEKNDANDVNKYIT